MVLVLFVHPGADKSPVNPKLEPHSGIGVRKSGQVGTPTLHITSPFEQNGKSVLPRFEKEEMDLQPTRPWSHIPSSLQQIGLFA